MRSKLLLSVLLTLFVTAGLFAQKYKSTEMATVTKSYQGVQFTSDKTLLENFTDVANFSTYASFLETHGSDVLKEGFMGTVFVIPDSSFEEDPDEPSEMDFSDNTIQKAILNMHIVPGRIDAHSLMKAIEKGGGTARFSTVSDELLMIRNGKNGMELYDTEGNTATIVATDFYHKNGFFHIVEGLVLPSSIE